MPVPMDSPADAILLPVNPALFRLSEVTVVSSHVFLFARLHAGFAVLQTASLLWAQGSILDPVGDTILLASFATVHLVHPRMARIDNAWSSACGGRSWGLSNGGTGKQQPCDCQDQ